MAWRVLTCILALAVGVFVSQVTAGAPPAKTPTIGWLGVGYPPSGSPGSPFFEGMKKLGWVEGKDLSVERRFAEEQPDRLPELAAELVRLKVDVIVAGDSAAIPAAKGATRTIPIVMTVSSDPVSQGFVASLARPGGNVTGLSNISPELAPKRVQLLKEIVPGMSCLAVLGPPSLPDWAELAAAARASGLRMLSLEVSDASDLEKALEKAAHERCDALIVIPSPITNFNRRRIVELAARRHLPAMYALGTYVNAGGLIAYGPNIDDLYYRAAAYVDKILRGAKPADLPIERPQKFELAINLKTAKSLGLTIPPSLLVSATEVIK